VPERKKTYILHLYDVLVVRIGGYRKRVLAGIIIIKREREEMGIKGVNWQKFISKRR
jgi:hypothetical protein